MSEHIRTDLDDGVLSIVMARPDKKNAITQAMYAALSEATERARADAAVRAVLLKAEGDSFSAGNDIGAFTRECLYACPAHAGRRRCDDGALAL